MTVIADTTQDMSRNHERDDVDTQRRVTWLCRDHGFGHSKATRLVRRFIRDSDRWAETGGGDAPEQRRGAEGARVAGASGRGRAARKVVRAGCEGVARPDRPRRCTLPITALRVTPPPSCLAIWLADWPSSQSFFSAPTRSSVQPAVMPPSSEFGFNI